MNLPKDVKTGICKEYERHEGDTGSPEVQVALLTHKIRELTQHVKFHKRDFTSRRGLLMMVGTRTKLLRHLRKKAPQRYADLIASLGLRR